jgi:simple sugar transport system permease protein
MVRTGAEAMSRASGVPVYLADVIEGVAMLTMAAGQLLVSYRVRLEARSV